MQKARSGVDRSKVYAPEEGINLLKDIPEIVNGFSTNSLGFEIIFSAKQLRYSEVDEVFKT